MTNKNTLTIVIPIYNTKKSLIKRCLKSIPDDERVSVYIYDDFSTEIDDIELLIHDIIEEENLKFLYNDKNKLCQLDKNIGLGAIRNKSIRDTKSKYIMFLDSDDTINTDSLLKELDKLKDEDILLGSIKLTNESKNFESIETSSKFFDQKMIPYFVTPNIYKRKVLLNNLIFFDESRLTFEDIPFSIKLWSIILCKFLSIRITEEVLYNYYLDDPSLTRTDSKDKLLNLHNTLIYWIEWIINYYSKLEYRDKGIVKTYFFNRIKYESIKSIELKMKYDGIYEDYKNLLNFTKPYRIDSVLN